MRKIGYLGPKGSFSEEAILLFLATHSEFNEAPPALFPSQQYHAYYMPVMTKK